MTNNHPKRCTCTPKPALDDRAVEAMHKFYPPDFRAKVEFPCPTCGGKVFEICDGKIEREKVYE